MVSYGKFLGCKAMTPEQQPRMCPLECVEMVACFGVWLLSIWFWTCFGLSQALHFLSFFKAAAWIYVELSVRFYLMAAGAATCSQSECMLSSSRVTITSTA